MKDLDFLRFRRNQIALEEQDIGVKELLGKTSTFKEVVERDTAFFVRSGLIDYSLLLGAICTSDEFGRSTIDQLKEQLEDDPSLAHGIYFTQ